MCVLVHACVCVREIEFETTSLTQLIWKLCGKKEPKHYRGD